MAEQERDLREIDEERAREERRRVLEEAARLCYLVPWEGPWKSAAQVLGDRIRDLIDKKPSRG